MSTFTGSCRTSKVYWQASATAATSDSGSEFNVGNGYIACMRFDLGIDLSLYTVTAMSLFMGSRHTGSLSTGYSCGFLGNETYPIPYSVQADTVALADFSIPKMSDRGTFTLTFDSAALSWFNGGSSIFLLRWWGGSLSRKLSGPTDSTSSYRPLLSFEYQDEAPKPASRSAVRSNDAWSSANGYVRVNGVWRPIVGARNYKLEG